MDSPARLLCSTNRAFSLELSSSGALGVPAVLILFELSSSGALGVPAVLILFPAKPLANSI
jgi:hypothetical protein